MTAYAALVSLAHTTDLNRYQLNNPFSIEAQERITSIHEYVLSLLSFLEDFPQNAEPWEDMIRYIAHEAEDFIEDFLWLRIQPHYEGRALPNLEDQLKHVMERVGIIAGDVMDERPSDFPAAATSSSSSTRLATIANDAVIGLDEDVTTIRGWLFGEPSNLHVIPIVGMGGIGKTTLARIVYDHSSILHHFDFRAWITVSQDYSPHSFRKIVLDLLESMNLLEELLSGQHENLHMQLQKIDVSEMTTHVFQNLKYRRYLIVIDDVWNTEIWDDLMMILPDDCNGSRIIVTTRLSEVAAYPNYRSPLHEMRVMNDAQSWDFLKRKVFTNAYCPPDLEGVGEEIARSCAGLPLAIVLIAGLLSVVSKTRASWEDIASNINTVVNREVDEILSLSYMHLPHHLRPCFLFLGVFPKDEIIRSSRLVKLWEAEGFLKYEHRCDKSLEEVAEEYLEDLVKRNLVFVDSRKSNGRIKSCSLHDMVRDLCIRKAREEKFIRVVDEYLDPQEMIHERHISLRLSNIDSLLVPTIRSILNFNLKDFDMLLGFLGYFRLLRVLHDANLDPKEFSFQIYELIHLRYLALKGLNITAAISQLVNLETLIIFSTSLRQKRNWKSDNKYASRLALPLEIWRMQQLKHLILYNLYTLPDPPESNPPLVNLQTLSLVKDLVWSEKMVEMIPNVKTLELAYTSYQECHLHHLHSLLHLEKLQVIRSWDSSWEGQNPTFPTTLKKLTLVGGRFRWAEMSIIGSLPNLQVLKLLDNACCGETWEIGDDEFPQLKYLLIEASFLRHWAMESSSMPVLGSLVLRSCWNLEKIPEEVGETSTLEVIELRDCEYSVVESAKDIKEFQRSCGNDAFQLRCSSVMSNHEI